ncbi:Flp pilus assembly protein TadB [Conyzicola lurida]|uniref:Flp pilus assembly protein TadB n=1 Tax=Conyzicola lurida TaxID=1172621 RepID=A0A841AQJ8_9MICO|nr:hypothetical protein [Conyzicola lurida]MBB5843976.1 Flp pilus assembly protein TadB [Conyzicola lurida]
MATRRSAFSEAGRRGPFAVLYWIATVLGVALIVVAYLSGSQELLLVAGLVGVLVVLVFSTVRYSAAARIEREREADGADTDTDS